MYEKKEGIIMTFEFVGKNFTVKDGLKEKIENKLSNLDRVIPEGSPVRVHIEETKNDIKKVEVTIALDKRTLRAQEVNEDIMTALDDVIDRLRKQMSKFRGQLQSKRRDARFEADYKALFQQETNEPEEEIKITRTKHFTIEPMDAEEAIMQMELLNHNFFAFRNSITDEVNVVYKGKHADTYNVIELHV